MEKDFEIYKGKKERIKSITLKAKKESSDDETSTSRSDDEEYAMAVKNFKKFFRRKGKFVRQPREERKSFRQRNEKKGKSNQKCFRCDDPTHLIGDCPKTSRNKDQKAFIRGSWSDSENDAEDKTNDKTCLMTQSSNEKLERSKEIEMTCKSCDELKLENAKLKETQVKFDKFDKSANSLREMLNNQKSPSYKIGLGFDSDKESTSGTKTMSFVGSSAEKVTDGSTIKGHGSTLPGSVSHKDSEKGTEHVFSPPMSSRSDFVITRNKLIHNSIDESKKPSLKPSLKSGGVAREHGRGGDRKWRRCGVGGVGRVDILADAGVVISRVNSPEGQDSHSDVRGRGNTSYESTVDHAVLRPGNIEISVKASTTLDAASRRRWTYFRRFVRGRYMTRTRASCVGLSNGGIFVWYEIIPTQVTQTLIVECISSDRHTQRNDLVVKDVRQCRISGQFRNAALRTDL
ncbi:zf-CCHC domain-containing protein [Tanacetum coccineum]|uniref:Zf-CCHC domain-containing protein n=1 Tax=Tanacetum coccineum TaxID=301880 RepID=A0ABQ5G4R7_9ASTR